MFTSKQKNGFGRKKVLEAVAEETAPRGGESWTKSHCIRNDSKGMGRPAGDEKANFGWGFKGPPTEKRGPRKVRGPQVGKTRSVQACREKNKYVRAGKRKRRKIKIRSVKFFPPKNSNSCREKVDERKKKSHSHMGRSYQEESFTAPKVGEKFDLRDEVKRMGIHSPGRLHS